MTQLILNQHDQGKFTVNTPDAIIFDLDGTLWDTCPACAVGWNNVLDNNQIAFREITASDVRSVAGKPHEECIRQIFHGLSEETLQILIKETMEEDNRIVRERGGEIYPGVCSGLQTLKSKYSLFIVSNCQKGYVETFFEYSGFKSHFEDFECWGNTGLTKAENLKTIMKRNNLHSPIYVGDTNGDKTAARLCSIPFVHVKYGFGHCDDFDLSVNSFSDFVCAFSGAKP